MKSRLFAPSVFSALLVMFVTESPAFLPPERVPLPNFDNRGKGNQPGEIVSAEQRAAVEELRTRLPVARVDFDAVIGSPKWISAGDEFLGGRNGVGKAITATAAAPFAGDSHAATKAFLSGYRRLFGFGPEVLDKARVKREFGTAHNGLKTVVWEQQVDNVPVFEAVLISHTTAGGELVNLASQFVPDAEGAATRGTPNRGAQPAAPGISARQAVAIAARNVGDQSDEQGIVPDQGAGPEAAIAGAEKRQQFKGAGLKGTAEAKLVWLAVSKDQLRLCWEIVFTSATRDEMFRTLVDVQTGEPLLRQGLTEYISNATYRVYTSDSPSPFSPGNATPVTNQPPLIARTLVTLAALDTNASPAGWINDGGNETLGNNVDAHTDRNADNSPDLPRPQGSPSRVFDFPLDLTQDPTTYSPAAAVQLFYVCNWMHDKLYQLGFTEAAGNFQGTNFGRGGLGNDPVQADAQDGGGFNNANMSTPSDGSPPRMQMYIFNNPTPDRDGDLDTEIVLHEYTHGLSNRRVGGGVGLSALQSTGMGEGWSDFYGLSLLSESGDNVNGNYAAGAYASYLIGSTALQNYYFGIRRYPYTTDMTKNPLTFKDIDSAQADYCASGAPYNTGFFGSCGTGNASEVHNQGELWCVTLWEARANLINKYGWAIGNQLILQLVTDGMNLSPANPNFLQARDAIIQADLVDNGGANRNELWAAFAKRGMGFSATSPSSSTTSDVFESFDTPDDLRITPVAGFVSSGPVGGPFIPNTISFTLTNVGSNALNWTLANTSSWLTVSPTSGGLTPGGPATSVVASVNNSATNLPMGIFSAPVWFTNLNNLRVQKRQFTLRVGQPDYFTELFDTSTNDLAFQSFTFTPDGSTSFYSVCRLAATNFPTDPTGGTNVTLTDDSFVQVTLADPNTVSLYGRRTNVFFIGSNGYLTMNSGDSTYTESFSTHFNRPRISALFHDLNPGAGGTVSWKQLPDRVAVTWLGVPDYGSTRTNNFQIEMFSDERIRLTYLSLKGPNNLVGLSAGQGVPAGFAASDFSAYSVCLPPLIVVVPPNATEGDGVLANAGQVQLAVAPTTNVTVTLSSSDTTEVTVPANVTITAGQTNAAFSLTVINDAELDGTQTSTISAAAPGFATGRASIAIFDNETAILRVVLPASTTEGQGTVQGSVQVSAAPATNVTVSLASSETTEIQVPSSVIMPGGQTSVVFTATVVNDREIDGPQIATVTAHVQHWTDGSTNITVLDNENLNLSVISPASANENAGILTNAGRVGLSGTLATNLTVALALSATNRMTVPSSITIPAGQTNGTFNLILVNNSVQDGNLSVTVTAGAPGFANGSASTLVLDDETPPVIVTQPASQAVVIGNTAVFSVGVTGGQPLSYQWRKASVPISGATNSAYSIVNVQTNNAGTYSVVVTNIYGTATSSNATLTVLTNTGIVAYFTDYDPSATGYEQPITNAGFTPIHVSNIFTLGFTNFSMLCINEDNNGALTAALQARLPDIQNWVNNGGKLIVHDRGVGLLSPNPFLMGATGAVTVRLTTADVDVIPPATNLVVAGPFGTINNTNLDGGNSSAHGYVTQASLPVPASRILSMGGTSNQVVAFSYSLGAGVIYYSTIPLDCYLAGGSCTASVIATNLQSIYTPNVLLYASSLTSCPNCPPTVVAQPAGLTVRPGTNVTFSVAAIGTQPLSYQWRKDGTNLANGGRISGAGTASLVISNVVESDSGVYSALVTNAFGSVASSNAALLVSSLDHFTWSTIPSPQYTNVPFAVTIQAQNATNGVVTSFTGVVALSGASGSNPVPITPASSGNFVQGVWTGSVTVASLISNLVLRADDGAGHSGLSNPLQVTASNQAPVIVVQPVSKTVKTGTNVTFTVTATGALPLSYQWRKNGANLVDGGNISGATTASLAISNIVNRSAGQYAVIVANAFGSVLSSNAILTISKGKGNAALVPDGTAPSLEFNSDGKRLLILWPADPTWVLETSTDLSPTSWSGISDSPVQMGDQFGVWVEMAERQRFYRLRLSAP